MSYLVIKPAVKEHACPTPTVYGLAAGTVWQCDGIPERPLKRRYNGCGKTYEVTKLQFSEYRVWREIEWPPQAPAGASPTGAKP